MAKDGICIAMEREVIKKLDSYILTLGMKNRGEFLQAMVEEFGLRFTTEMQPVSLAQANLRLRIFPRYPKTT